MVLKRKIKKTKECPAKTIERQKEIILMLAKRCAKQRRRIYELERQCKDCRFRELFENNL